MPKEDVPKIAVDKHCLILLKGFGYFLYPQIHIKLTRFEDNDGRQLP